MRKSIFLLSFILLGCLGMSAQTKSDLVKEITSAQFKQLVSEYEGGYANWQMKGVKPIIIDFYATWCGPCRKLSPIVEELAEEYKGKIDFYKIDIDKNKEIAKAYAISSIPMLLFAPIKGKPQSVVGLYPKEELEKTIKYMFFPPAKKVVAKKVSK